MLKEDALLQIFHEGTSGKNYNEGLRVLNNELVSNFDIQSEGTTININAKVISESLFHEYSTKIIMDANQKCIVSTYCSCKDFEKRGLQKKNYCCKHLVAAFYRSLDELIQQPFMDVEEIQEKHRITENKNMLSMLLGDRKEKDEIKIEIYINKDTWDQHLTAEFKIGLSSMSSSNLNVLKDIPQFLTALCDKIPVSYSKNFTLYIKDQRLNTKDRRVIDFIETLKSMEEKLNLKGKHAEKLIDGKYLHIPSHLIREFFEVVRKHKIYLNEGFFNRPFETEIVHGAPPVEFELNIVKDEYLLSSPSGMPIVLSEKNDVFLYGTTIYLPDYDYCYKMEPYLQAFHEVKTVSLTIAEEESILRKLVPDLNKLSPSVMLSKVVKDKIAAIECAFSFYFDKSEECVTLLVKMKYGPYEFNIFEECEENSIYRDREKENQIITTLITLGFEINRDRFYFTKGDDCIYTFFKRDIQELHRLGEIYYSERFKGLKVIGIQGISGTIEAGKYDYFELRFQVGDLPPEETRDILRAFRDNLKYYKLKSGEYLDLEELELRKFMKLLDVVSPKEDIVENLVQIPKSKGLYVSNFLEENDLRYFTGKTALNEISNKLKCIEKLEFQVPTDLKANLRDYQKIGYNWLKMLEHLGFGGILGDEMGLGKTLQTITFIASNKGSKSLIIAPTSLVYNWASEFEKFAPSVTAVVAVGSKEEREGLLRSISCCDVVITTYNLLKRDLECYQKIDFDHCILDEAQYIKNANSQNAKAVKEIKARIKFALSGTPIENSLMEIWSIFDFIMPGYLYDERRFSVRFYKRMREEPVILEELNRLIKPFILRRRKKDVLVELPSKIEKTLMVTLDEKQKEIYSTYAKHAVELIKNKVKDDEFQNSKIEILSYIMKLRQLCLDPSVVMKNYSGGNGKLEALVELLQHSIEEGHKVLVFSQFTSVLKNIGKRISIENITYCYLDGAIPSEKRMSLIEQFDRGEADVFLISLKAGGTGLNLTSADIVIHYDPWWNPAVEEQATDRAHRIGQENVVEVIKMISKDTIEEKITALQEEKKRLVSELLGDDFTNTEYFRGLSEKDILGLFSKD